MFSNHPSMEELRRFTRGIFQPIYPPQAGTSRLLRHLLAECPACLERLSALSWDSQPLVRLLRPETEEAFAERALTEGYDYSKAFAAAERAVSAFLAPECQGAESPSVVLAELKSLPAEEQIRKVSNGGRFADPEVVHALID